MRMRAENADNHITELGLLQLCVLLEEGFCTHLMEINVESRDGKGGRDG